MTTLLSIENLNVMFHSRSADVAAVRDISMTVAAGECVGIVGESGSGKTVAFMATMGLLPRTARVGGSIRFEQLQVVASAPRDMNRVRGSRLAMIFQDPMTALTPHLKIGVQLAEVLVIHEGTSWRAAQAAALHMLERVRVPDPHRCLKQYPHELSGGMRQRVMIGMSLLCNPLLLIADEPTTALDVTVQAEILDILRTLQQELRMAIVLISHDLGVVSALADKILVMYAGRVVETCPVGGLRLGAAHPYTAELLKCMPDLAQPRLQRMFSLPGSPPNPADAEEGCAFAPRCPQVRERCRVERPLLVEHGPSGRSAACHYPIQA